MRRIDQDPATHPDKLHDADSPVLTSISFQKQKPTDLSVTTTTTSPSVDLMEREAERALATEELIDEMREDASQFEQSLSAQHRTLAAHIRQVSRIMKHMDDATFRRCYQQLYDLSASCHSFRHEMAKKFYGDDTTNFSAPCLFSSNDRREIQQRFFGKPAA